MTENLTQTQLYDGLDPIERATIKAIVDRLNYSQLEIIIRIANENPLPTDQVMAEQFANDLFTGDDSDRKMQAFIKGYFQHRGREILETKTRHGI